MIIRKSMTNSEIYSVASSLANFFQDMAEIQLPVKVHFYFQKNMNSIIEMAKELEQSRAEILNKYGTLDEESQTYKFETSEKTEQATKDINDLFSVEQEVKIHQIPLEWFDSVELTANQVSALSYMIEDADEEE